MANKIDTEMFCSRCGEGLDLAEMHCNEQEYGGAICDDCVSIECGYVDFGVAEDGSGFFICEKLDVQ